MKLASMTTHRFAFTLIELLVVIAILSLLVSILFPSLQKAMTLTRQAECTANLRTIGTSLLMYINDNGGMFPTHDADQSSWPYVYYDWAMMRSNFSAAYMPQDSTGKRLLFCTEALKTLPSGSKIPDSYESYPNNPASGGMEIPYCYFMGFDYRAPVNLRGGVGRIEDVKITANTTMMADLMRFGATAPYYPVTWWNHTGYMGQVKPLDQAGGNMVYVDGHAAWMQGLSNLLANRQPMKGNDTKSYCAQQPK